MKTVKTTMAAVALLGAIATAAPAAVLNKTYSYFYIGGTTLDEIQDELGKRGPHVESTGARHPGATRLEFNSRVGYQQIGRDDVSPGFGSAARSLFGIGSGCQISSATVTVKAKVILPRWRRPAKAEPDVRFIWSTLEQDIKRHEESHVVIAKNHARMIEDRLNAMPFQKDCDIASAKAEEISRKVLAEHDREQQRFDRVESKNFEKRLMNLLKYRLEQSAAARPKG